MSLRKLSAAFVVVLLMVVAAPKVASAATIGFTCLSNNSGVCGTYASLITGEGTINGNQLTLLITNGSAGVITDLYVDAPGTGTGYTFSSYIENPDALVNFSTSGAPNDLMEGNQANPDFEASFEFHAGDPSPTNGAGTGEQIGLVFTLAPAQLATVAADLLDGDLRIGFHLQALPGGFSESLISTPGGIITAPEPASMLLLGTGLLVAARAARRRKTS